MCLSCMARKAGQMRNGLNVNDLRCYACGYGYKDEDLRQ